MNAPGLCREETRRALTRKAEYNGIDYVEVEPNLRTLIVHFLGRAPSGLSAENVAIEGGRRVRDIRVERLVVHHGADERSDDSLEVNLDRTGDASTYRLSFVEAVVDENGRPLLDAAGMRRFRPLTSFDPRYHAIDFSFHAACPSDLDCAPADACPTNEEPRVAIDYLAKDYASFRRLMLDRLALTLPEWTERHVPDLGVTLVELFAYVADHLSYYQDAVATEAYLDTARRRISVRRHARLVDYVLHEGTNSRSFVCVETDTPFHLQAENAFFVTGREADPGTGLLAEGDLAALFVPGSFEVFEPLFAEKGDELAFFPGHNEIHFYAWGDRECCLPRGATRATLSDAALSASYPGSGAIRPEVGVAALPNDPGAQIPRSLRLNPSGGDVLVFEEVIGPQTGNPADADPTRRHAVRLTRAEPAVDPVTGWPVIEIEWAAEDALPFPFCLSSVGPAPECRYLDHVSVARGNVVLVDNGRSLPREPLGEAPVTPEDVTCECPGLASPSRWKAARFAPELAERPLTFRETPTRGLPASLALAQDPRRALPSVALTSYGFRRQASDDDASGSANVVWSGPLAWHARPDLLASGPGDAHFVVEMDDDRGAHLRFGDGRQGRAPSSDLKFVATGEPAPGPAPDSEAGTLFYASYRVGNGARGNVGAESISYLVTRGERVTGVSVNVRNPLPARGGTEPEPVSEAKLYAPHAFRRRIERAVTAGDYARIAEREFAAEVQRAAGRLRWTGSWYEALVAVDARGTPTPASSLLERVERRLYRYRRVLHDLAVLPAEQVPLDIELLVCVRPHHERGHVKQALLAAFSNRTLGDGRLGFFHPDELSFDDDVYASRIVALARSIPGVEHVELTRFQRLYEPPNGELAEGVLWLSPVEVARLDNDPNFPENGALRLVLRGGR